MTKEYRNVLLLKAPYCEFNTSDPSRDADFRNKKTFRPWPSLALASLCAFIEQYDTFGYHIKAIDINVEAYSSPCEHIDVSVYPSLVENTILENDYDVLSISAMFVFNYQWVDMIVKLSRMHHPDAKIVIGGGYPTIFPERCLTDHEIDDAIIGEGEDTLLHVLHKYNNFVDENFTTKFPFSGHAGKQSTGEIVVSSKRQYFLNLEELPSPAWHYLNVEKFFKNSGDSLLSVEASRGCPYQCTYCCTYLSWGRKVRYKSVKKVIDEMVELKNKFNVGVIHFVDDNATFSKQWVKEFMETLIEMGSPVRFQFSNFSAKHLDEEIIDLLIRSGINYIAIAIETGSKEIQNQIKKHIDFDQVRDIVKLIKLKGMEVHICWMVGFPHETLEQINETFALARELRADMNHYYIVLPYPGTKLFDEAKAAQLLLIDSDNLENFDYRIGGAIKSDEWNYEQLFEMIYDINIELNFLNNVLLDQEGGREIMLQRCEGLLLKLPEHVVASMTAGFLHKLKGNLEQSNEYYDNTKRLLEDEKLANVFGRYLLWDNSIVRDYLEFVAE